MADVVKTRAGIFLKPLGKSLSALDYSIRSLTGGQVTRATQGAQAGHPLCFYMNIQLYFSQGKVTPYYIIQISH